MQRESFWHLFDTVFEKSPAKTTSDKAGSNEKLIQYCICWFNRHKSRNAVVLLGERY